MEFIPLERYSKNGNVKVSTEKERPRKNKKIIEHERNEGFIVKEKQQSKAFDKRNVKNKYKETLALKKKRIPDKKKMGKGEEEDEEVAEDEEQKDLEDEDGEEEKGNEAFKRKCQEMHDREKNRLFVKLKKKILNQAQIRDLHPDIKDVIFPRKKNSRWCWAVFESEERADEAMKQLIKNKEVLVSRPTPYDKVDKKQKEKMKTVLRKKEARRKLQKMWM